jgi:lipopolysaccharide biosynthesis regulator YciM
MSEAGGRYHERTVAAPGVIGPDNVTPSRLAASPPLTCNRCGFPVRSKPWGCKNPCANCGTVYPLGDCSD